MTTEQQRAERIVAITQRAADMDEAARQAWERGGNADSIAASLMAISLKLARLDQTIGDVGFFIGDRS